ncbi:hypothetical protein BC828DRAFT_141490 [Blastocladiella britannica]|nr:hypothetical protein BC828DRAFT_141490 [Blastocladiella britannica]
MSFRFLIKKAVAREKAKDSTPEPPPHVPSPLLHVHEPMAVTLYDVFAHPVLSPTLLPLFQETAHAQYMPETVLFYETYLKVRREVSHPEWLPPLLAQHAPPTSLSANRGSISGGRRRGSLGVMGSGADFSASNSTSRNALLAAAASNATSTPPTALSTNLQLPGSITISTSALDAVRDPDPTAVQEIVQKYVEPSSPQSLNLSGALRAQILAAAAAATPLPESPGGGGIGGETSNGMASSGVTVKHLDLIGKEAGRHLQGNLLPVFRGVLEFKVLEARKADEEHLRKLAERAAQGGAKVGSRGKKGLSE